MKRNEEEKKRNQTPSAIPIKKEKHYFHFKNRLIYKFFLKKTYLLTGKTSKEKRKEKEQETKRSTRTIHKENARRTQRTRPQNTKAEEKDRIFEYGYRKLTTHTLSQAMSNMMEKYCGKGQKSDPPRSVGEGAGLPRQPHLLVSLATPSPTG